MMMSAGEKMILLVGLLATKNIVAISHDDSTAASISFDEIDHAFGRPLENSLKRKRTISASKESEKSSIDPLSILDFERTLEELSHEMFRGLSSLSYDFSAGRGDDFGDVSAALPDNNDGTSKSNNTAAPDATAASDEIVYSYTCKNNILTESIASSPATSSSASSTNVNVAYSYEVEMSRNDTALVGSVGDQILSTVSSSLLGCASSPSTGGRSLLFLHRRVLTAATSVASTGPTHDIVDFCVPKDGAEICLKVQSSLELLVDGNAISSEEVGSNVLQTIEGAMDDGSLASAIDGIQSISFIKDDDEPIIILDDSGETPAIPTLADHSSPITTTTTTTHTNTAPTTTLPTAPVTSASSSTSSLDGETGDENEEAEVGNNEGEISTATATTTTTTTTTSENPENSSADSSSASPSSLESNNVEADGERTNVHVEAATRTTAFVVLVVGAAAIFGTFLHTRHRRHQQQAQSLSFSSSSFGRNNSNAPVKRINHLQDIEEDLTYDNTIV